MSNDMKDLAHVDPDVVLDELREAVQKLAAAVSVENAELVVEKFNDLDEWLSRGGFPPDAWTGLPRT